MALTKPPVLPAWAETGDKVQPTNAEIQAGWPLSNIPPARQRWNWILNFVANGIRYLTRRGLPDWANDETYEIGDVTRGPDGLSYKALTQNINKSPAANPTDWELWAFNASGLLGVVDGFLNKNVAGAVDVALTAAEARNGIINLSGAITANINVTVPATARRWTFINNTTGGFTLTVKTPLGTGYALPQGVPAALFCDGTNVDLQNELGATAAQFDNSAKLATTAFVKRQGVSSAATVVVNATTVLTADAHAGKTIYAGNAAPITLTLPLLSTMQDGSQIQFDNTSSGLVTISRQGADNIAGLNNIAATAYALNSGDQITLVASPALGQWFIITHASLGVGQTWQNLTGSRAFATTYTNTTGRPIAIAVTPTNTGSTGSTGVSISVNGTLVTQNVGLNGIGPGNLSYGCTAIVPPGATYLVGAIAAGISSWFELR